MLEQKLYAIKGDITLPKFGISPDDMELLSSSCTIVFNSAATIRFVEPIEVAVRNNIYSVGQLVEFCDQLNKLEALIHLSTAYSNCHKRDKIHEILYEPPMRAEQIQDSLEKLRSIQNSINVHKELDNRDQQQQQQRDNEDEDDDEHDSEFGCPPAREHCKLQRFFFDGRLVKSPMESVMGVDLLEEFTRVALRKSNRPNTYTFTKAISETYLVEKVRAKPERYLGPNGIPVAIIRPSIVGGAWREPFVGQVDNYNGPTGAILSLYTGALQAMPGIGSRIADLVPVDMVSNMVLCTGWFLLSSHPATKTTDNHEKTKPKARGQVRHDHGVYLFNFVSGNRNPLHWELVTQLIAHLAYKYPSKYLVRLPSSYFLRGGPMYDLYDLINQKFPAYLMDLVRGKVLGQDVSGKSSAMYAYARVRQMTETLTSFTSNQWKFCDTNVRFLFDSMSPTDKLMFHFDVTSINWTDYITKYIIGSRIYTLKDEAKNVPRALVMIKRRRIAHGITMAFLIFLFYQLFISGSQLDICTLF